MFDRKLILRILLWALGVAAVTGAMAMLLGASEVMGRVAGTALVVAIACGLALPLSLMIDRARVRPAGLLGMAVVVAEFILAIALIWMPNWARAFSSSWPLEAALGVTMGALAIAGPLAMGFTTATSTPVGRVAGWVGNAITAAIFLLVVGTVWWGFVTQTSSWWWQEKIWGSCLALGGLGVPAIGALVGLGVAPARHWRWLGVAASVAAFAMALVGIWGNPHGGEAIFTTVITLAVVVAHANLALFCPTKPGQSWLVLGTIGMTILTAAMIDGFAFLKDEWLPFGRLAAASGIMAACGTLALFVLARINRGVNLEHVYHQFVDIALTCPRCRRKQTLPLGDATCAACGLRISTRIEEPRCPKCDYLLYMLTSDRCPECGEPIASAAPARAAL